MVMADRPDVRTASLPVAAITVVGLAESLVNGLARVPFRRPWQGPDSATENLGRAVTRQVVRSFMGYSMGLPIEEFRSMEKALDRICSVVMPPFVERVDGVDITSDTIAGVSGLWCRRREPASDAEPARGTILYLHGGGYIGTSPMMYSAFAASLARGTSCDVFVADYRLAPEFPFPAGVHDAADVYAALIERGVDPHTLVVAGDSGGGGLATSLMAMLPERDLPTPAALVLFSPEIDLDLDHPSITDNAARDILPWNVPVTPYLHGVQPEDARVSAVFAPPDPERFPPTFVCAGGDEMFRDGIREYVHTLEDAGVEVHYVEEPAMFHVFPILMPWAAASHDVVEHLDEFVTRHLGTRHRTSTAA